MNNRRKLLIALTLLELPTLDLPRQDTRDTVCVFHLGKGLCLLRATLGITI